MTSKPRRMHPAALIFLAYTSIRSVIVPLIILAIGMNNGNAQFQKIIMVIVAVLIIWSVADIFVDYFMYTYQLLESEIVIRSGLFVKKVNHVPYKRIQNITTNQWFFLKPFKLVQLEIETAGHSETSEVSLKAVPSSLKDEINQLRNGVQVVEDIKPVAQNTYQISWSDLLSFSLTSPAFLSGLLVVLAAYGKISDLISDQFYADVATKAAGLGVLVIVFLVILVVVIFYVGSALILIAKYYHFRLTENDGQFVIERGLFQTKKTTIATERIQAIVIKQPLMRSFLKIATIQLVIVSNSNQDDTEKDIIVMPVIKTDKIPQFMAQFFKSVPFAIPEFQPQKFTYFYNFRNYSLWFLPVLAILIATLHNHIFVVAILAIVVLMLWNVPAYLESKRSKVTVLNRDYIFLQNSSLLTKQTMFIPKMTIQFLKRRNSLWLEKKQIAGLTVNVRSGITERSFSVDYQKQTDIDSVMKWYKE